jgi:hypothetical protein
MKIFKPTWKKIIIALVISLGLSFLGSYLHLVGSCWFSYPCTAYSPIKLFLAYIFDWPTFIILRITGGNFDNNFYQAFVYEFGWLVNLIYYYVIVSIVTYFIRLKRP